MLWTLNLGQVSVAIMALCLIDLVLLRRTAFAGVLIAFAMAIKVTPALFIVYLLLVDRRAGIRALLCAGGFTLLGAVELPGHTWRYFTAYLWDTSRVGDAAVNLNVSVTGILARTGVDPATARWGWIAFTLRVLAISLVAIRRVWHPDSGVWAACIIGQATCLMAPFTWNHHAAWFSLTGTLLLVWAIRERERPWLLRAGGALLGAAIIVVLFAFALAWSAPGAPTGGVEGFVVRNNLFLVGIDGMVGLWTVAFLADDQRGPNAPPVACAGLQN